MSRYAVWQRSQEELQKSMRVARQGMPNPAVRKAWLAVGGLALYLGAVAVVIWGVPGGRYLAPFMNVVVMLMPNYFARKRSGEANLLDNIQEDGVRVRAKVCDPRGRTNGTDTGRLVHCDGWLLFEGKHTRFSFTQAEATQFPYEALGNVFLHDGRSVEFSSTEPGFSYLIREWERAPIPSGKSILPPSEVHPDVWAARGEVWLGVGTVSFCLAVAALLFHVSWLWPMFLFSGLASISQWRQGVRRACVEWNRLDQLNAGAFQELSAHGTPDPILRRSEA